MIGIGLSIPISAVHRGGGAPNPATIPGIYNYNTSYLANWRTGRAAQRAGTRNAIVSFAGDSTTAGSGGGSPGGLDNSVAGGYIPQLAALVSGASWQSFFGDHNGLGNGNTTPLTQLDSRITYGGGWTGTEAAGHTSFPCAGGPMIVTLTGGRLTFTPTKPIDTVKVFAPTNTDLTNQTIDFDGTGAGTLTTQTALGITSATFSTTLGTHTIGATGSNSYLGGMYAYNSAVKEISLVNLGWNSGTAADWSTGDNSSGLPWAPLTTLPIWPGAPDLTFIDLTINDWIAATDVPTWSGQIQSIITVAKTTGDVVLMTGVPSDTGQVSTVTQQAFVTALKALAVSNNCVMIDWTAAWGSWTAANGSGWMFDVFHPNHIGYGKQAAQLAILLNS